MQGTKNLAGGQLSLQSSDGICTVPFVARTTTTKCQVPVAARLSWNAAQPLPQMWLICQEFLESAPHKELPENARTVFATLYDAVKAANNVYEKDINPQLTYCQKMETEDSLFGNVNVVINSPLHNVWSMTFRKSSEHDV